MPNENRLAAEWAPRMLSVLRIVVGLLFMEHGSAKLLGFPHVAGFDQLQPFQLLWFAGVLELFGGGLIVLGLFTRPAAFLLSGEMAVGYFMFHNRIAFFPLLNHGEAAAFYCWVFLYFFAAGAGPWSLDRIFMRRGGGVARA